jgi:hypothetical protein
LVFENPGHCCPSAQSTAAAVMGGQVTMTGITAAVQQFFNKYLFVHMAISGSCSRLNGQQKY